MTIPRLSCNLGTHEGKTQKIHSIPGNDLNVACPKARKYLTIDTYTDAIRLYCVSLGIPITVHVSIIDTSITQASCSHSTLMHMEIFRTDDQDRW